MITKETARRIYNCYQQIEEIDRLKKEMLEEVEKASVNVLVYITEHESRNYIRESWEVQCGFANILRYGLCISLGKSY